MSFAATLSQGKGSAQSRSFAPDKSFVRDKRPVILHNVSADFKPSTRDVQIIGQIVKHWETPFAIRYFAKHCKPLTSYSYWYMLGTLWVSYSGWSDLALWKELFSSTRQNRETSLMKPDEVAAFRRLPEVVRVYRAHRPGEVDWIAYTLDPQIAARFAKERGISEVAIYDVDRTDILALFLRRGEKEVLVLDKSRARHVRTVPVLVSPPRLLATWKFSQVVPGDAGCGSDRCFASSMVIYTDDALRISKLIRLAPGVCAEDYLDADGTIPANRLPSDSIVSYLVTGGNANLLSYPLGAPDEVKDVVFGKVLELLLADPDATKVLAKREERLKLHLNSMSEVSDRETINQ